MIREYVNALFVNPSYGNLGICDWSISKKVLREWVNLSLSDSFRDYYFNAIMGLWQSSSDSDVGF